MHTLTIRTKFTFGDRVRFDSRTQHCSGTGTICGITIARDGWLGYEIEPDDRPVIQPGIVEDEITLLADEAP